MDFLLLGPVAVESATGPVAIGGAKPRTLLAALLVDDGRVVPTGRLIDAIWGLDPPDSARPLIQTYVSALRRALADGKITSGDAIRTHSSGYSINVDPARLDRRVFEDHIARGRRAALDGRHHDAAQAFRDGLALWRGPALGGITESFLAAEAARLDEMRLVTTEDWLAAELALGRGDVLIAELTALVGRHPTRERLRGQLMIALYRAGRTAEALAAFRAGREAMIEELGIDAGPGLRRLHEEILREAPTLSAAVGETVTVPERPPPAVPAAAQLPPDLHDFTGRTTEIEALVAALHSGPDVPSMVGCVITGPGGAGKSTLAVRVAHQVAAAFPDGQLYVDLHGMTDSPVQPEHVLGRFLRALGEDPTGFPETLAEYTARYRSLTAGRRILVVLDDAESAQQVRPLLPGGSGCAVLITSRNRLASLPAATVVELGILCPPDARDLLAHIVGDDRVLAEPTAAREIVAHCGHLPLAVRIAGARLASRRHWTLRQLADRLADERRRLDELTVGDQEVRATIALSYHALDDRERAALRGLGLLGVPHFPVWALGCLLDVDTAVADQVVERLLDAHLLEFGHIDGVGEVRYRLHDLVRLFASEQSHDTDPAPERAASVARVVNGWLWLMSRIAESVPTGMIQIRPVSVARQALPQATTCRAVGDPRAWFDSEHGGLVVGIERAAALDLDEIAVDLASALCGSTSWWRSSSRRHHEAMAAALEAARRAGNRRGEATLLAEFGQLRCQQDRYVESRELLESALVIFRECDDMHGQAATLAALGSTCRDQGALGDAAHYVSLASTACRSLADDNAIGYARRLAGAVYTEQGRYAEATQELQASLVAYRRAGSVRGAAMTLRSQSLLKRAVGDFGAALDLAAHSFAMFREVGDEMLAAYSMRAMAKAWIRLGQHDLARHPLAEALTTSRTLHDRWGEAVTLRTLGELELAAGRLDAAGEHLGAALAIWEALGQPVFRARTLRDLAALYDARGDTPAADAVRAEAMDEFRRSGAREFHELAGDARQDLMRRAVG